MLAPSIASSRELELKLELPSDDFRRLGASPFLAASPDGHTHKVLRSVYFDTPENSLHKARISLRLRNDGGSGWLQTVKAGEEPKGGLSDVAQVEALLQKCEPDLKRISDKRLRRKIKKICKHEDLRPVFETIVQRTTHVLKREDCTVELALDEGRIVAGGQTSELREAELELLSGSIADFLAIARELFSNVRIRPGAFSKAERGYRLLAGEPYRLDPVYSEEITLRHGDTARSAFAAILQSSAEHIAANQRVILESGAVEAVHQMRVGLTRLRSALRSLKPYINAPWVAELEADAQQLARAVGHLRDADVLIQDIYAPVADSASAVPGFSGLLEAVQAQRMSAYKEVVDSLDNGVWPRLLLTMTLSSHLIQAEGTLDEPIETVSGDILERRWKKVRKYGKRLDTLDLEERHSMRKALKKLRYNCEFFQTLYNRKAESFINRMKKMQELFGAINDMRMAQRLIDLALGWSGKDRTALAAAGYVVGRHEANMPRLWGKSKLEWERLDRASGFWL